MSDQSQITDIRAFNRFYTRRLGLLEEHMLKSPYSLAEGRVLFEIGVAGRALARDLGIDLGLDPAYLSRILQKFATAGLTETMPDDADRRRIWIALTADGRKARDGLVRAWNKAVGAMLAPIDPLGRTRLVDAMATITQVLSPQTEGTLTLRPHRNGELGWLIHRQGLLYNQQFGWDISFEALIAGIYEEFQSLPAMPPKDLWVADLSGRIVGSIFVIPFKRSKRTAQLRMLYVEPEARGQGVGARLVAQAVTFARSSGYSRMRLWTHTVQQSAGRLYAAAGFKIVETMDEDNFGVKMQGEIWELKL